MGVGRTDGEGIEQDWSMINPVVYSTREMTPGHCADTLDDHWGDWNWRKVSGMGRALVCRIKAAAPECITHSTEFHAMCESLPAHRMDEWTAMVKTWEAESTIKLPRDVTAENPYILYSIALEITQPAVRLELTQDDAARSAAGEVTMHEVSPSQFIITGLELQEHQHRIREDRKALTSGTSTQRANLQERRNLLRRKIDAWISIQAIYMPGVVPMRAELDRRLAALPKPIPHAHEPEERLLLLPSEVANVSGIRLMGLELAEIELKLCEAQAFDSLRDIRHYLRLLSFVWKNKNKNSRGQRENTRSQTLIRRTDAKKCSSVHRYRQAWKALLALKPGGNWSASLKELHDKDVRGLAEAEGNETEGRRMVSWIWAAPGVGTGAEEADVGLHDSLRVEWCKLCARALRWTEEIQLLREEMRQVLAWFTWRASWWWDGSGRHSEELELQEGICSHASRQAQLHLDMRATCAAFFTEANAFVDKAIAEAEGTKKTD